VSIIYSRLVCAMLDIRIRVAGKPVVGRPVLVVANHVSWADILVITATVPTIFVAKSEVARWPLIGLVAKARGTVFVDRNRRHQTAEANADIAARLGDGASIVLFGEGTSGDGNRVLPFRTSLFGAVNEALRRAGLNDVLVQPLALTYTHVQGLPMGRQHRPIVAWYGDIDLVPHLIAFIKRGPVDVTLRWGEPVALTAKTDRKAMAKSLERSVRQMMAQSLRERPATVA
jgi:1-acyl-sn-glycerol-3-phosphate acyltransferase